MSFSGLLGVARGPAIFYSYIAVSVPTQICERFEESCNACLARFITLGVRPEQQADAPPLVALLPTCGEWPRGEATHRDDELATPHYSSQIQARIVAGKADNLKGGMSALGQKRTCAVH